LGRRAERRLRLRLLRLREMLLLWLLWEGLGLRLQLLHHVLEQMLLLLPLFQPLLQNFSSMSLLLKFCSSSMSLLQKGLGVMVLLLKLLQADCCLGPGPQNAAARRGQKRVAEVVARRAQAQ
jgi:hypothetical protein